MSASIQVIRGKKLFVIIETMFGVATSGYAEPVEELTRHLRCNGLRANPTTISMPTIFASDREVKRLASMDKLN